MFHLPVGAVTGARKSAATMVLVPREVKCLFGQKCVYFGRFRKHFVHFRNVAPRPPVRLPHPRRACFPTMRVCSLSFESVRICSCILGCAHPDGPRVRALHRANISAVEFAIAVVDSPLDVPAPYADTPSVTVTRVRIVPAHKVMMVRSQSSEATAAGRGPE
jgi:hypothetical protein